MVPEVDMNDQAPTPNDDGIDPAARAAGHQPALTGCPWHDVNEMLQAAGLRPTRQRMALGWLLFGKGAPSDRGNAVRGSDAGQGSGVAGDRLQHAQSTHRCRSVAPGLGRRHQDLFRHQRHRAPPLLSRTTTSWSTFPIRMVLSKMPDVPEGYEIARASTWSCACARSASDKHCLSYAGLTRVFAQCPRCLFEADGLPGQASKRAASGGMQQTEAAAHSTFSSA